MHIAVTGAEGYVGRHAVKALLEAGHSVAGISRSRRAGLQHDPAHYTLYVGDCLGDSSISYDSLGRPDVLLHLAWRDVPVHNAPSHLEDLPKHVSFIKRLIDGGLSHVAGVGSMHEVGYHEGMVTADTPTRPGSLYGVAKNALRQSLEIICNTSGVTFQWLRLFYTYGDDLNSSGSVFKRIRELDAIGESLFPMTAGTNRFDYVHIDELASQIAMTLEQRIVTGTVHCGSGIPTAMKDQIARYLEENQLAIRPAFGAFPARAHESPCMFGDASAIRAISLNARAASSD